MSENYADVITFVRAFADWYALDDTASASDALATESGVNKNNIVNVSEALNFILNLGPTDSATVSEVLAISFDTTPSDSATISESIQVALILGASSVLNTSTLNTYVLNS